MDRLAEQALRAAIRMNPQDPVSWTYLGMVMEVRPHSAKMGYDKKTDFWKNIQVSSFVSPPPKKKNLKLYFPLTEKTHKSQIDISSSQKVTKMHIILSCVPRELCRFCTVLQSIYLIESFLLSGLFNSTRLEDGHCEGKGQVFPPI